MYLADYIENCYANAKYGSADYRISEYLLMNLNRISEISLSEIAREIGFPKSTVSTFFSSPGLGGGYNSFQYSLKTEFGIKAMPTEKHVQWTRKYVKNLSDYKAVSDSAVANLASRIMQSKAFYIVGPIRYRDCFLTLTYYLRTLGIHTRYISGLQINTAGELSESSEKGKLVVFLSPSDTYTEFMYKLDGTPQISTAYREITGEIYYVCRKNDSGSAKINTILFKPRSNPYDWITSAQVFANELFLKCVSTGNTDMKQPIYIL